MRVKLALISVKSYNYIINIIIVDKSTLSENIPGGTTAGSSQLTRWYPAPVKESGVSKLPITRAFTLRSLTPRTGVVK